MTFSSRGPAQLPWPAVRDLSVQWEPCWKCEKETFWSCMLLFGRRSWLKKFKKIEASWCLTEPLLLVHRKTVVGGKKTLAQRTHSHACVHERTQSCTLIITSFCLLNSLRGRNAFKFCEARLICFHKSVASFGPRLRSIICLLNPAALVLFTELHWRGLCGRSWARRYSLWG